MKILGVTTLSIADVKVIGFGRFGDHRGYFTETYRRSDFTDMPELDFLKGHGFVQCNESFSTIALRQGTVCGYSPRMRFDLIVNAMYKTAMAEGQITVNNPSIWRPILAVEDACAAFLRAVQADLSINGVFNVASGNYTVGQVGDMVRGPHERRDEYGDFADTSFYNIAVFKELLPSKGPSARPPGEPEQAAAPKGPGS